MIYGYAKILKSDKSRDRQIISLMIAGIDDENIVVDELDTTNQERRNFNHLINILKPSDTLVIKSIDCLGWSYEEILEYWNFIAKKKRAYINVVDMPMLNVSKTRDFSGVDGMEFLLQVLSYMAQTEKNFMRQKQAEGIAAARDRGVKFGRRPLEIPEDFINTYQLWNRGSISGRKAAELLQVSNHTFKKWVDEYNEHKISETLER